GIWPGVRRAGLPKPEPGADAGPAERRAHAGRWTDTGLIFTTRYGTPIEPRNFTRSFDLRIRRAGVRRITVHGTRKTCGTLLAALDVHPASRCRFSGTAGSASRWRSTLRPRRR